MFRGLSRQGNMAYLVDGSHLWTLDVSDALNPKLIDRWGPIGHAIKVQAVNTMAYISAVDQGFLIVDTITQTVMGRYTPQGYIMDAYVRPPYAYLAAGRAGLKVIDVSNPASPYEIGSLSTPGYAAGIHVSGSTAFIADCGYLDIVNISTPGSPSLLSSITIPGGNAKEVFADGGFAFVADNGNGLYSVDARVPTAPRIAGGYDVTTSTGFYVNGVAVSQGYAYIASGDRELTAINVSDPYSLMIRQAYPVDPLGVALSGTTVYSLGNYRSVGERKADAFDISTPGSLRHLSAFSQPLSVTSVAGYGNYALALDEEKGLFVVDAANNSVVGTYVPPVPSTDIKTTQGYAFLRDVNHKISIVSLSSPSAPSLRAVIDGISAWSYAVTGERLYIFGMTDGGDDNEIFIYSLASPSTPSFLGSFVLGSADRIAASGDYLYADKGGEVDVIDVSDASSPRALTSFTTVNICADVFYGPIAHDSDFFMENGVLYLFCGGGPFDMLILYEVIKPFVEAYDIRDPRHPRFIDSIALPQGARNRVSAQGDFLFALSGDNNSYTSSLRMFQRVRGKIPGLSGSFIKYSPYAFSGYDGALAASGNNLYIFDDGRRVRIVDLSFPLFPWEKGLVTVQ